MFITLLTDITVSEMFTVGSWNMHYMCSWLWSSCKIMLC